MVALPVILRPCAWRLEEDLARLQARPTDGRPLSLGSESEIDLNLSELAYELAARVGKSPAAIAPPDVAANASANGPVSNPRKAEPFTGSAEWSRAVAVDGSPARVGRNSQPPHVLSFT